MEEYEAIFRRIREYEERIRRRAETIEYFETIVATIREEHPELTHYELLAINPEYRRTYFSIWALKGWQTRDRKVIEELKKIIPPIEAMRVRLTFSIETGEGHEPFYAEVTCDTVIGIEETAPLHRLMNVTIKLFWIIFDIGKALKDLEWLKDKEPRLYDEIVRRKEFFQKYAEEIYEYAMDNMLLRIIKLGGLDRSPDEYVTVQALIKIGVEYLPAVPEAEPKYPKVRVLIEKGTSKETKGQWVIERLLLIADESKVNMLRRLGITYEEEG